VENKIFYHYHKRTKTMTEKIIASLRAINNNSRSPQVLTNCSAPAEQALYDERRKVFNRKFRFMPAAIVMCEYTEDVQDVMKLANLLNFEIRVRSGGHDHEGECSATSVVVIDLSRMKGVTVEKNGSTNIARVQPGNIFKELIPRLTAEGVCIPHGTCGTVGIAGYTLGGGWGPWTRIHGMCCESLIGATIVLGDGNKVEVKQGDPLLWALRGGGGMSYGIVTEFVFNAFTMPDDTIKFQVDWDFSPAYEVLKLWEGLIAPDANVKLIGTNLKIVGIPKLLSGNVKKTIHPCTFYGYYAGTEAELKADMMKWFASLPPTRITVPDDANDAGEMKGFDVWDRISTPQLLQRLAASSNGPAPLLTQMLGAGPLMVQSIPPDVDPPAPHKITSRLVKENSWDDAGRENLITSLQSDLIYMEGIKAGVQCYVTLGAISGSYYAQYKDPGYPNGSAFPYKKRPFTIQYQAWWNVNPDSAPPPANSNVYDYTNRAEDWIEVCRSFSFPQTEGSFISFKDDAVPTADYFMQSYTQLKTVKESESKDPLNRLRSRKTII
jgi:hypothetical protein